jgi:ABC-type phosphate transport system substrate-binding protein
MKEMKKLMLFMFIAAALAVQPLAAQAQVIQVDGSSTVFPVTEAVAEEFQKAKKGKLKVTVGISGTGGGFKKFCRGETDISNASRPILKQEIEACKGAGVEFFVGAIHDGRRTEENLGTCRAGQDHKLESGSVQLAQCAAEAFRRRRRLGNL